MTTSTRRNFLRMAGTATLGLAAAACAQAQPRAATLAPEAPVASPDEALQRLMDGNKRFTEFKQLHPNETRARLTEVAAGQKPFASIMGCADSRVPPEEVFDRGLGDLFVVRAAGNLADDIAIGSLEFSVAALGSSLIMVLGHSKCGAVAAAVKGDPVPGYIAEVVADIQPAVARVQGQTGDAAVENAIKENVRIVAEQLGAKSQILAEAVQSGKIKIVGAVYDLDTGAVNMV
jgi:carbonic anhydrase